MATTLGLITLGGVSTIAVSTTATIITSITSISNNVITLLGHITSVATISNHQSEIISLLNKTDIEATIKLLHAIILEIPSSYDSNSVLISLTNVKDSISQIEDELKNIHTKIEYNSSLYLMANLRSYNCEPNLENIKIKIAILDRRTDYLFKILDVCKSFHKLS